ncbi:putative tyrosyl-DNA phosphodiesterase [Scheffersomyces amazonensis]|uniref:putative tyrosyl-DNA phosphodiesterase n=1 Tax=Scheffersomyces amazonensis TaxID=1078765 RepID=UPI00315CC737
MTGGPNKRSEAFRAAASHWANMPKRPKLNSTSAESRSSNVAAPDIIDISSDEESQEDIIKVQLKKSPIKLLYNPSYDQSEESKVNKDTISIHNLVGVKDLSETFQFNFNVDLLFFLKYLHPEFSKKRRRITFITGSKLLEPGPVSDLINSKFNYHEIIANIPNRFGSHHTKMMINFFEDDTCEIVIMTCNFTKLDFGGLTQMIWRSERLQKGQTTTIQGSRFRKDLLDYLLKYNKPDINSLVERLKLFNFSSIEVELIASAPGVYDILNSNKDDEIYGYGKFYQVLKRNHLLIDNRTASKMYNFLAQVTSISYPSIVEKSQTGSIFTHIIAPMVFSGNQEFKILQPGAKSSKQHQKDHYYMPHLIFPSVKEMSTNNVGFGAGQAIHFNYTQSFVHKNQYEQNIKPYLRKWNSSGKDQVTGREFVMPHCKFFICDNGDNWNSLKWLLVGSHNLSKQAWGGSSQKKETKGVSSKYEVSSYELSVMIIPKQNEKLVPCYGIDTVATSDVQPVRLPFKLPPVSYEKDDTPWANRMSHGNIKDKFGETYNID